MWKKLFVDICTKKEIRRTQKPEYSVQVEKYTANRSEVRENQRYGIKCENCFFVSIWTKTGTRMICKPILFSKDQKLHQIWVRNNSQVWEKLRIWNKMCNNVS